MTKDEKAKFQAELEAATQKIASKNDPAKKYDWTIAFKIIIKHQFENERQRITRFGFSERGRRFLKGQGIIEAQRGQKWASQDSSIF